MWEGKRIFYAEKSHINDIRVEKVSLLRKAGVFLFEFKQSFFGYRKDEVDLYFQNRERDVQPLIKSKYAELEEIRASNQRNKASIREAMQQEEDLNSKKELIFQSFIEQFSQIEESLKNIQQDIKKTKLNALQRLQLKAAELDQWNSHLEQCFSDISALRDKYLSSSMSLNNQKAGDEHV